jgi:cell wall-associated NlpC family hydrolase
MTDYRYLRRWRRRLRRAMRRHPLAALAAAVITLALAVHLGPGALARARAAVPAAMVPAAASPAQARVISQAEAYAKAQIGCPYVWGGTGPCSAGFDCSGLVMQAYASAGVTIERTSQEQWAEGPQIPTPRPGDLVFFAGADGTDTSPGHVGLVIGRNMMIEAYATGFPVRVSPFGTPAAAPGDTDPIGFTAPWEAG